MNDYILEAADVTNVSVSDIELTQLFAEAAVLEAMMNCYEKQITLMEYNEESAEEIFIEMNLAPRDKYKVPEPSTSESSTPATVAQKNLGNNIKKALSRAGAIIVKLFSSIMGAITSQKFQTLKKSLEKYEMGAEGYGVQLTDFELGYINHLSNLNRSIDEATKYLEEARNVKTEKEANDLAKKIKMSAAQIIDKTIYEIHDEEEDHVLTHAEMKALCDYLANKEIIGKLNNLRYNTAKWNTDYNWVDTVPPAVGDAIRTMVKNMMTAFKFISSGLNKIIKQEVDETKKTNKQVKKIMKEDKKAKKNNDSDQADENSADDNLQEESYSMNLTDSDYDYYAESTRGEIRKHDFLSWLIGWTGARYNPDNTWDFHWPKLVLSLLGMSQVAGIWAMIENYKAMRENIDDIINVEIVKIASAVLDDLKTDANGTSVNTTLSKFKKDLKELIKECKNDEKMGKSNELRSKVSDLRTAAERVLTNPKDNENLQSLVNAINAIFEKCIDKSKLPKSKNSAKTESYNMNLSEDEDFF